MANPAAKPAAAKPAGKVAPKPTGVKSGDGPSKSEIYKQKRLARLSDVKAKDDIKYRLAINPKEAKDAGLATSWKDFCEMKKAASIAFWDAQVAKPVGGAGKMVERKKARAAKLREMLAALETELGDDTAEA